MMRIRFSDACSVLAIFSTCIRTRKWKKKKNKKWIHLKEMEAYDLVNVYHKISMKDNTISSIYWLDKNDWIQTKPLKFSTLIGRYCIHGPISEYQTRQSHSLLHFLSLDKIDFAQFWKMLPKYSHRFTINLKGCVIANYGDVIIICNNINMGKERGKGF